LTLLPLVGLAIPFILYFELFAVGRYRLGSLLSFSHSSGKTDKLYMKGPGGRGEVEVAVSGVEGTEPICFLLFA